MLPASVPGFLIVEDDPDIAKTDPPLPGEGREHRRSAVVGRGGHSGLRSRLPDLVILDLMLPELDGLMVCQAMRSDPQTALIPIIMLTARGEEADRSPVWSSGRMTT